MLAPDRTRYVFTDVSDLFLERARERFAAYPFMEYRRFDLEQDPQTQGYSPASFDVIVSANAVHATADLRLSLQRLRELLAPGGVLVLLESTTHLDWFDMTTGLIEGWQRFADDLRTDNPLLPPQTWLNALQTAGFAESMALPEEGSVASDLGQHVLVASVPGALAGGIADADEAVPAATTAASGSSVAGGSIAEQAAELRQRLMDSLPADRLAMLRDFVRERVVRVLKLDAASPPGRHDRLMDLGFDSLMAVQLRNQLAKGLALDRPLPATVMFDHPTIEALATYLLDRVAPAAAAAGTASGSVTAAGSGAAAGVPSTAAPVLGVAAVAAMSEEQIEELLLERLDKS